MIVERVHSSTGEIRSHNADRIACMMSASIKIRFLSLAEALYDQ